MTKKKKCSGHCHDTELNHTHDNLIRRICILEERFSAFCIKHEDLKDRFVHLLFNLHVLRNKKPWYLKKLW